MTAGAAAKLQVLLQNQFNDPGNVATKGRTGVPNNATAGVTYNITVNLTDAFYNVQTNATTA